ncbi:hypothetical protein P0136_04665 [Lentisphaerota bacterium ZTH]|nr:hypothetical protein JYG24_04215 [Lentisphaerota bacterium]WET07285.1 hypothetical protein P0136_04665 [Lentisphaerota bacterium ZTH]
MLKFCGQDCCSVDANGRIKLSPRVISDFAEECGSEVVMHCLPEGAIALYPEKIYLEMRQNEEQAAAQAAASVVFRRSMRRFGAMSKSESISRQGRITLPPTFRKYAALEAGCEVCVVGVEIGVEIWNAERWMAEIDKINEHAMEKGEREMAMDLTTPKPQE